MRVIRHSSRSRVAWDFLAIPLALVSVFVVTYELAFTHRVSLAGSVLVYGIDLFFLVDVWLNRRTTYRKRGEEISHRDQMRRHYSTSLMPLDLSASIPLDALLLALPGLQLAGLPVVLLLRLSRLLRVGHLLGILVRWERLGAVNPGVLRIARFVLLIAVALHLLACAWFLVPYLDGFPADSWVSEAGLESMDAGSQYIRSLYWSIVTTTTVGYGDITPERNVEYLFAMVAILLGASIYAFIIGNIASLVSNLDAAKATFWRRAEGVEQYLRTRDVEPSLTREVRDYYDYVWARFRGLDERDFLRDLPSSMRLEIYMQLARDLVETVPMFRLCSGPLRNEILLALDPQIVPPGHFLVREGEAGQGIFFISGGRVEILRGDPAVVCGELQAGDHFGELSLLLGERRSASVRAITHCDVFVLERARFNEIKSTYPELRDVMSRVAEERSEKMAALVMEGVTL